MSNPMRLIIALLAAAVAAPVGAEDKPPAKPGGARQAALVRTGYTPVPLTIGTWGDFMLYVAGTVGAEKVKFMLDSGCGETVLDLAVAKGLKLKLGDEAASVGAGGRWAGRRVVFPGLTFGPYDISKDWHRFDGVASDLSGFSSGSPTGLFGMGALHTWASVVDYPARTLYLRPPHVTAWPRLAGTWTVINWQEEEEARKFDLNAPPTFTFTDHRLKFTDGGQTREYAIRLVSDYDGVDKVILFDPKHEGKRVTEILAGGLIKVVGGRMNACVALDVKKAKNPPTEFAAAKGSGLVLLELKHTSPGVADKKTADPLRELMARNGYTAVPMETIPGGKRVVNARAGRHTLRLGVDTGASMSGFDRAELDKWEAERLGKMEVEGLGGRVEVEEIHLRGLTLSKYDTRRAWAVVQGGAFDLAELNRALAERKLLPIQGVLGNLDLLTGSAVIDFGTNTLYLRSAKDTIWPQLDGKWVGVRYESNGKKGRYTPGNAAVEFKDGRVRFTTRDGTAEWGFHLRDEGLAYRVGLFDPKANELADGFKYSSTGLLKLDGGTLTLVMQREQIRKKLTEFAAPAGSGLVLVEYERAK
jgi:hypothetical protein